MKHIKYSQHYPAEIPPYPQSHSQLFNPARTRLSFGANAMKAAKKPCGYVFCQTEYRDWLFYLGHPNTIATMLNVMGASIFLTYPWIFNTGNLPREMSVTLLNTVSVVNGQFTTVKVPRVSAPIVLFS